MRQKTWLKWTVAIGIAIAMIGASILWYVQPDTGGGANVVARVNGEEITKDTLHEHLEEVYGSEALETLIMYQLILSAAEKAGLTPNEEDIEAEINLLKTQFGDVGFEQFLAQYGLNEQGLRHNLLISTALDEMRFAEIEFTDADLEAYFEENPEEFATPEKIRASHILVASEEKLQEMLDLLTDGEDFGALASQHSLDTASAEAEGDLGLFSRGTMYPEFEDAAFSLEIGEVSGPVETQAGFHIIKLTDRQPAKDAVFSEVRDQVEHAYQMVHAPPRDEIVHRLQQDADVQIFWPQQ